MRVCTAINALLRCVCMHAPTHLRPEWKSAHMQMDTNLVAVVKGDAVLACHFVVDIYAASVPVQCTNWRLQVSTHDACLPWCARLAL